MLTFQELRRIEHFASRMIYAESALRIIAATSACPEARALADKTLACADQLNRHYQENTPKTDR